MPPRLRRRKRGGTSWASREADRLWSLIVRQTNSGECYLRGVTFPFMAAHTCNGSLQAAHGFSRRYRVTRWLIINGFPLCAAAHMRMTHDPLTWDRLLREWWGLETYDELRQKALSMEKMDPREVLELLRAEASRLGLAA